MNLLKLILISMSVFASQMAFGQSKDISKMIHAQASSDDRGVEDLGTDNYRIVIEKIALGQEFLLQGNFVFHTAVPSFEGIRSKIVTFKQRANTLILEEVMADSVISSDIPVTKLLAVFPVVAETAESITFDWAGGFSALFYSGDWFASDFYWYGSAFYEEAINVAQSYVEDANIENNILTIRHISQIDNSFLWWSSRETLEVRWYIKPYETNPAFTPTEFSNFSRYGFFQSNPLTRPDHSVVHATKFDSSKPIVFSISANTPAEYRDAVRDGILYWNKAFGVEAVQAIDAPAGVTAPNAHHNVVQWINWDNAGFAYADAQMDPRTGEILHAQVFLTSAFAFSGAKRAAMLLQGFSDQSNVEMRNEMREAFKAFDFSKYTENSKQEFKKSKAVKTPSLKGFERGNLCLRDNTAQLEMALADFISRGLSDKEILKVSQDYVREVVAHEIGHTLGLRHNFAGSLAANFTTDQRPALYAKYLSTGSTPEGTVASSSVMEYQRFEESTMSGDQIKNAATALTYDDKAVKILYSGAQFPNAEIPIYCTDSHAYRYNDCQVFDSGLSTYAWPIQEFKDRQALAAKRLASQIVLWSTHPAYRNRTIDQMFMAPFSIAWYMTDPLWEHVWTLISMKNPLLRVERQFDSITQWNYQQIMDQSLEANLADLASIGGLNALFPALNSRMTESILTELRTLLSNENFTSAMSYGPKPFSFTAEQVNHIMSLAEMGYSKISHIAIKDQIMVATLLGWIGEIFGRWFGGMAIPLTGVDTALVTSFVTQKDGVAFSGTIWVPSGWFLRLKQVSIPNFAYNFQERMTAATASKKPNLADAELIKAEMVAAFGLRSAEEIAKINIGALPKEVAQWVNENNALIAELSKVPVEPANWWDL